MLPSCPADNIILESKGCVSKTNTSSACPFIQQSHIVKEGLQVLSLKLKTRIDIAYKDFKKCINDSNVYQYMYKFLFDNIKKCLFCSFKNKIIVQKKILIYYIIYKLLTNKL